MFLKFFVFFYSNVDGDSNYLELGQEVEYSVPNRIGPGGKISAENVRILPVGTLPTPKVRIDKF